MGWSHGKETLKTGRYDTLKGSFYVNCAFYQDPALNAVPADGYPYLPEYTAPNVWPPEIELPGFRTTFEEFCTLIIDVAILVARVCDQYASVHVEGYEQGYLEHVVKTSLTTKARLLHYFPTNSSSFTDLKGESKDRGVGGDEDEDEDDWCATHVDHGCLTGLTSALFINESPSLPQPKLPLPTLSTFATSPDPSAGLYIRSRVGSSTKVAIPVDCVAFQTGEALEIITGGKFKAVPHYVKGPKMEGLDQIARNTLAVFTQPNLGEVIDRKAGTTFADFARRVVGRHT